MLGTFQVEEFWSHLPDQAAKGMWSNNRSMRRKLVSKTFLGKGKIPGKNKKNWEPGPWPWPISIRPIVTTLSTSEPIVLYRIRERKEVYKKPSILIGKTGKECTKNMEIAFHQSRSAKDPLVVGWLEISVQFWASSTIQTTSSRLAENKQHQHTRFKWKPTSW